MTADVYTFSIDYFANGDKGAKANDVLLAATSVTTVPEPGTSIWGALASVALGYTQRPLPDERR